MVNQAIISASPDITIETGRKAPYHFTPEGFPEPIATPLVTTVTAPFVDSRMPTHMVLDSSQHEWIIYITGTTATQLQNRIEALRDALLQFSFVITTTRDDVVRTWNCWPGLMVPTDNGRDEGMQAQLMAKYALTIPCDPIGGTS